MTRGRSNEENAKQPASDAEQSYNGNGLSIDEHTDFTPPRDASALAAKMLSTMPESIPKTFAIYP